ncbi:MAG: Wzz/FepE/Etk N-terminal domain-containing protein [Bryobacteraceae bacterium]
MQATASTGFLSRRALDLDDYLSIIRRHVSWILAPALAGLTLAVVITHLMEDTYVSTAAIRVLPPTVPEKFVPSNTSMQMATRVEAMKQTILSRQTLTNIIETFDLYRKERDRRPMQDVIEEMAGNINVSTPQSLRQAETAAFYISFSYSDRYAAQRVTRDLMSRFINENLHQRQNESKQTTQFLKDAYDTAKLELNEAERKLTEWKMQNIDRLPETIGVSMSQMSVLEARVATLNSSVSRARQEQSVLEAELRAQREKLNAIMRAPTDPLPGARGAAAAPGEASETDQALARVEKELQTLERGLERMLEQYKPTYPDVQRLQSRIATLKKERDSLLDQKLAVGAVSRPGAPAPAGPAAPRMSAARAREIAEIEAGITRLLGQIRAKEMEAERYLKEIADTDRRSGAVQRRLELGPVGAVQQEQLMREFELAQKRYEDAKAKYSQSEQAEAIESRKQGETLEVLENPSLPDRPEAPNRPVLVLVGTIIGLMVGTALAAVRELKDTSLKSLKDVRAYTQFNILGSIPLLENDFIVRRRRRLAVIGWTVAGIVCTILMAISVYYYYDTHAL